VQSFPLNPLLILLIHFRAKLNIHNFLIYFILLHPVPPFQNRKKIKIATAATYGECVGVEPLVVLQNDVNMVDTIYFYPFLFHRISGEMSYVNENFPFSILLTNIYSEKVIRS
jgi:hypothetical protein